MNNEQTNNRNSNSNIDSNSSDNDDSGDNDGSARNHQPSKRDSRVEGKCWSFWSFIKAQDSTSSSRYPACVFIVAFTLRGSVHACADSPPSSSSD